MLTVSVNRPSANGYDGGSITIYFDQGTIGSKSQMAEFIAYLGHAAGLFDSKVLEEVHVKMVEAMLK
ncbi:MAG: hypothetical protein Q7R39_02895 [Dehalococcoidia bacterium]|nr:hypothetical protein [Dehalococcoidia bacterium]